MNEKVTGILRAKFHKKHIRQRDVGSGRDKRSVDYVQGSLVIRRLNEAFDHEWTFEVKDRIVDTAESQVAILGRLTVPMWRLVQLKSESKDSYEAPTEVDGKTEMAENASLSVTNSESSEYYEVVKEQWGGASIKRYSSTKTIISLGDDIKAATTDSLKKCASLLGIGLHLYDKDEGSTYGVSQDSSPKQEDHTEVKPSTKSQHNAMRKVLSAFKAKEADLLKELSVDSIEDIDYATAAEIVTIKHPFMLKAKQNSK